MIASPASPSYDVLIVGAGPAGAIAAHALASQGLTVALLEKEALPRYKTCGGGIVYRCLSRLPISVDDCVEARCYQAQMGIPGSHLAFRVERSNPIISMTMRSAFDFRLVEAARGAGARILDQTRCRKVRRKPDSIEVQTDRSIFRGRFLLAADGVHSPIARNLQWPDQAHAIPALEWELSVPARVLDRFQGLAQFDFNVAKEGYAWVFPKKRHLSVGILSIRRGSQNLRRALLNYLAWREIPVQSPLHQSGHLIPIRPRPTLTQPRVLLLGDAAGLAEPVTCEGISFALQSGRLAAQALLEGELRSPESEWAYRRMLERRIGRELKWGRAAATLTYQYPGLRDLLFRRQGQRLCEVMTDIFMGRSSYRSLARQPWNYLKLLRRLG